MFNSTIHNVRIQSAYNSIIKSISHEKECSFCHPLGHAHLYTPSQLPTHTHTHTSTHTAALINETHPSLDPYTPLKANETVKPTKSLPQCLKNTPSLSGTPISVFLCLGAILSGASVSGTSGASVSGTSGSSVSGTSGASVSGTSGTSVSGTSSRGHQAHSSREHQDIRLRDIRRRGILLGASVSAFLSLGVIRLDAIRLEDIRLRLGRP